MIDLDIQQKLQLELIDNEKLIWTGRPRTGVVFRATDIFLVPFSLVWFGVVIFALGDNGVNEVKMPVALFFIPFIIAGLFITVGRFFVDSKRRANTVYGITDNRVIIKSGMFSKSVNSLNIKTLSGITIDKKSDGSGTITIGPTDYRFALVQGLMWQGNKQTPKLELINDVKNVYSLLLKIQRG